MRFARVNQKLILVALNHFFLSKYGKPIKGGRKKKSLEQCAWKARVEMKTAGYGLERENELKCHVPTGQEINKSLRIIDSSDI